MPDPTPDQLTLPMPPADPAPAEVHALLHRWWTNNRRWQSQWKTLQALLADPAAAHLLTCARAALVAARHRRGQRTRAARHDPR